MGLDNSILFRFKRKGSKTVHTIEVCYWRKYWNLRRDVLNELDNEFVSSIEGQYFIPQEDSSVLEAIAEILSKHSKISYCSKNLDCPWDAAEQAYHNRKELINLQFLIELIDGKISLYDFFTAAECWDTAHFKEEYFEMVAEDESEIEYKIVYTDSY